MSNCTSIVVHVIEATHAIGTIDNKIFLIKFFDFEFTLVLWLVQLTAFLFLHHKNRIIIFIFQCDSQHYKLLSSYYLSKVLTIYFSISTRSIFTDFHTVIADHLFIKNYLKDIISFEIIFIIFPVLCRVELHVNVQQFVYLRLMFLLLVYYHLFNAPPFTFYYIIHGTTK